MKCERCGLEFKDCLCSDCLKSFVKTERPLTEGEDYYFENGLMVMTAKFLLKRGYCCKNDCRNCPY